MRAEGGAAEGAPAAMMEGVEQPGPAGAAAAGAGAGGGATTAASAHRLMIREMVLDNFKSYAGPQSVGPFHKSFSSVVGPNGSGKSNVIDALLFVFGRRAKQLRFNKVSELIHNSTNFQDLEMAKVTVHFQQIIDLPGDDYQVVPNSHFSVARTAHRNNTSDYYVNDRKVSAKEVTDRLKGMGIDLDNNRFLILQGEVEQISMMRPKAEDKNDTGLLEYLEDIIGTHAYVQPLEEASKQLEEMNEKRQGLIQRLKVAEREKGALEGKKAEAEMFLAKQGEMLQARICGTTIYMMQTEQNLAKLADKAREAEGKLKYEREKGAEEEEKTKAAEAMLQAADKDAKGCAQALEEAEAAFKAFERKDAKGQIELKDLADKVKKVTAKMEKDATAAKKAEAEATALQEAAPGAAQALANMQQELVTAETKLEEMHEGLRGEVEGYHQQLTEVRTKLAPWEKKVGEATGRISVLTAERDVLARRVEDAKKRLDAAVKALAAAQQGSAARDKHIKELEASANKCRKEIEAHRAELESSQAEEARLEAQVREARERVAALKADVANASGSGAMSQLMVALMTARAKGELTGLYGRLGDLGAIDAKYDVAVSTAVGALDYIVVETTTDAQKCVEYLRRHNLGVATCLILEKQRHLAQAASTKLDTPEGCPRLFDLVRVKDEALLPAFYFACGNTLVAQDLDQASRIAYGKDARFRRVVTLQGQLIAESGTMTGGAGRPSRGRMALGTSAPKGGAGAGAGGLDAKAAAAELKAAEQQLDKVSGALAAARDRCEACGKALKAAEKQLADLELAAPKARMEAQAEADKAADIQQRLDSLRAATQVDAQEAARIAGLSTDIAREEAQVAELRRQMQGLEQQAAALQAQIDNAGGEKLKAAKAKVTKLQKDIHEAEADASKKAVQLKSCLKLVDKVSKDREKDEKERVKLEEQVARLQAELKDMEEQALEVMQRRNACRAELAEKQQALEAVRAEVREVTSKHAIICKTQLELEGMLEQMAKITREESGKITKWQREVEALSKKVAEVTGEPAAPVDRAALEGHKADDYIYKAGVIEAELEKMRPDLEAIEQYRAKAADYDARAAQLDAATKERDEVRRGYEALRKRRLDEFMAGFNVISLKLKEMYQMITLGGDAELELVDSLDPFSEGIVFSVRPPKKSWKNISNLSGGEKTLSSLSLVFALHHYKPTPLYVMDEIDAALDFKNVSIVAHYIKERTRNAQFIIISLRNNMFELADRLVGIYKTDNTTKTVTINPGTFVGGQHQDAHAGDRQPQAAAGTAAARMVTAV